MILDNKKATRHEFRVVHPLDDVREVKLDPMGLGPMRLTRSVRFSLLVLRGYLAIMALLVVYHFLDLGGVV
jgi:hypothetical protein